MVAQKCVSVIEFVEKAPSSSLLRPAALLSSSSLGFCGRVPIELIGLLKCFACCAAVCVTKLVPRSGTTHVPWDTAMSCPFLDATVALAEIRPDHSSHLWRNPCLSHQVVKIGRACQFCLVSKRHACDALISTDVAGAPWHMTLISLLNATHSFVELGSTSDVLRAF